MLRILGLSYVHKGKVLLEGIDSSIPDQALTCLVGANGAGKTTMLRLLVGELRPTSGDFLIDDRKSSLFSREELVRLFSIVPQNVQAPPHLTVSELVSLGRFRPSGALWWSLKERDREIVDLCLRACQIDHLATRQVDHLSGGEQQRVWVAFGLSQQKRFLLLDETLGGMDVLAKEPFFRLLGKIAGDGTGVVLTTHDVDLASRFADRVIVLSRGRVTYEGPPMADLRGCLSGQAFA